MAPPPPAMISSLSLSLSLPPRTSAATPTPARSIKSHGLTSSKTACIGVGTSPRARKHAQFVRRQPEVRMASAVATAKASPSTSPMRPKRPLSASRVSSPTLASRGGGHSFSPRVRPASASQACSMALDRSVNDVDTIPIAISDIGVHRQGFFPTIADLDSDSDHGIGIRPTFAPVTSASKAAAALPVTTDPVAAHAKFQAFLEMWEDEQTHFRSSVLFSETTFAQAKAMVSDWPRPNVLLSAIALGSLEQLGHSLEKQYPFLLGLVDEVGAAMYANFDQLAKPPDQDGGNKKNRFLVYFQHGRLWFQALAGEQQLNHSLRASDTTQRDEIERLTDALQEQKTAHLVEKMQDRVKRAVRSKEAPREEHHVSELEAGAACHSALPLLARLLLHGDNDSADTVLATSDGSFREFVGEMVRVFSSLNDTHVLVLLRALLDSANADREHKPLAELLAIAVDALDEPARREFLREYFAFVASDELQDALRERDECNDAKRLASFVDELFDCLGLDPSTSTTNSGTTTFHSDQARVIKSVLDRTELLQEIAAEFCFLDDETSARALSEDLRRRLRAFETPARRIAKAQQLMASTSSSVSSASPSKEALTPATGSTSACTCTCGNHRLVGVDEQAEDEYDKANSSTSDGDGGKGDNDGKQRRRSRRRSSMGTRRRKNGVNFGSQLASSAYGKRASASLRIFPLSEVCRLLTSILHLQFSRDAVDEASNYSSLNRAGGEVSMLSMDDDRWAFLRCAPKPNFKTLARDFLTRKYGIKSIAVMHSLQLERSLAHYAALQNHTRCDLFAWFFGADRSTPRLSSKDYAFRFFQRLVKTLIKLLAAKKPQPSLSSASSSVTGSVSLAISSPSTPPLTISATTNLTRLNTLLSYSTLVSIWTESIGDGESSSPSSAEAKSLPPAVAIEACRLVFPRSMQDDHPAFGALLERFYRVGLDKKPVELEGFLRRVMDAWQSGFEAIASKISECIQQATRLDFDGFGQCLAANGLELTGGERLELFDLLTSESDTFGNDEDDDGGRGGAVVAAKKRLVHFLLEAKYLLPVT